MRPIPLRLLLPAAALIAAGCAATLRQPAVLRVTDRDSHTKAVVAAARDTVLVDLASPGGIGHASFELGPGRRPQQILLRLHLKGLEELRFSFGDTLIVVSTDARVPNMSEVRAHLRVIGADGEAAGGERELGPFDAAWMQVWITSPLGYPTLPARENWIEVAVPPSFLRSEARRFEVRWVDFFR